MHICFLMPVHWSYGLGGAELQVRYIIDYIQRHTSHEVSIICCAAAQDSDAGVPIYRSRPCLPLRRYTLATDYFSITSHLRRLAPDVVYTRTSTPLVGFAARFCQRFNKKLVYHIAHINDVTPIAEQRSPDIIRRIERPLYEYGLRRAQVIIAQAKYQATLLQQNYGLVPTAVISNFHPIPPYQKKTSDSLIILWVANLKPAKRPEFFVELAERCADIEQAKFVMIGALQNPIYRSLLDRAKQLSNFTYLGHKPIEDVNDYFATAHIFVNTSHIDGEGFPNTFIQAWSRGAPVLSLEVDPDQILERCEVGRQCRNDFELLESKLRELVVDERLLQEMSHQVHEFAASHYGEANCARIVELIEAPVSANNTFA